MKRIIRDLIDQRRDAPSKPSITRRKKKQQSRAVRAERTRLRLAEARVEAEARRLALQQARAEQRRAEQDRRREAAQAARLAALREWHNRPSEITRLVSRPGAPHEPAYSHVEAEARRIHLEMHMPLLLNHLTGLGLSEVIAQEVLTTAALDILEGRAYAWDARFDVVRARRSLAGNRPSKEAFQYNRPVDE